MSNERIETEERRCGIDLKALEDANITSEDNKALVVGVIKSNLEVSYVSSITGERHYKTSISVSRKSGQEDSIRVMIPERLIGKNREKFVRGVGVKVSGAFCSHLHKEEGEKNRLRLYVLAQNIELLNYERVPKQNNLVYLKGTVKKTPFTKRSIASQKKITELFISVKHKNHTKFDYIPCVTWGRSAYEAEELEVGDQIVLVGRIQSRSYWEKGKDTKRIIHEVSVFGILDITKKELD